jgi:hypothetical protein
MQKTMEMDFCVVFCEWGIDWYMFPHAREFNQIIIGFHCGILQSIWRGVNLECIHAYAVLEWANDTKLHVFATKHKANTYSEQLVHSDDCVSI